MVGVGRDLCGSPSPNSLPKQDHLEQAAQDHVQMGFEYLQRRRLHNPAAQPVPVLWSSTQLIHSDKHDCQTVNNRQEES